MEDAGVVLGIAIAPMLLCAGYGILATTVNNRATLPLQLRIFVVAFSIRFFAALLIYEFGLNRVLQDEDASGWRYGESLRIQWAGEQKSIFDFPVLFLRSYGEHHRGYYYLLGMLFHVLGDASRLAAAALNCFIGSLVVVINYRVAYALFSPSIARRVGWWACWFPSLVVWSAQTIKEPAVILLESVALYGCVRLRCSGMSFRHVALIAVAIVLMWPFRFYATYITLGAVLLALLTPRTAVASRNRKGLTVPGALLVVGAMLAIAVWLVPWETQIEQYDLQFIQRFRKNVATDQGSGLFLDLDLQSPSGFGLAFLVGFAHLLWAPFPWQLASGSTRMLLVAPEMVLWWWLFIVGVIPGLRYSLKHRFWDVQPLLIFILGMSLLYSVIFANVGLVYRQRAQLLPWLLIFAAVGLELRWRGQFGSTGHFPRVAKVNQPQCGRSDLANSS